MDSAVSIGCKQYQNKTDVIGHNIANVNTLLGYQSYSFKEAMYRDSSHPVNRRSSRWQHNGGQKVNGFSMDTAKYDGFHQYRYVLPPHHHGGLNACINGQAGNPRPYSTKEIDVDGDAATCDRCIKESEFCHTRGDSSSLTVRDTYRWNEFYIRIPPDGNNDLKQAKL